eukprot:CAMPEP_0183332020 /NCGR_PEP_ID=MMETSP0164_2-20130417/1274_1 /TAXON_ID=221442 /ORGANISM="Coccolithus pelagicus ssp braarudi, Strain PLY182g" /LENGTH=122 /DNA_ID=CAMNT_0025500649 /DNA_START=22 /DNA_END=390 /DNA_ORIENTATION=-
MRFGGARELSVEQPSDNEAAQRWLEARQATEAAGPDRQKKRDDVLRTSMLYGASAALVSTGTVAWLLNRIKGGIRARNPPAVAFTLFMSFFMPFSVVANLTRGRLQGAKTALTRAVERAEPE